MFIFKNFLINAAIWGSHVVFRGSSTIGVKEEEREKRKNPLNFTCVAQKNAKCFMLYGKEIKLNKNKIELNKIKLNEIV